jgi:hypothetical protein
MTRIGWVAAVLSFAACDRHALIGELRPPVDASDTPVDAPGAPPSPGATDGQSPGNAVVDGRPAESIAPDAPVADAPIERPSSESQDGGRPAFLSIGPMEAQFPAILVGEKAAMDATFTVTNLGGGPSGLLSVTAPAAFPVRLDGCSNSTLGPQSTCKVILGFAPASLGAQVGQLVISADPGGRLAANLQGSGTSLLFRAKPLKFSR